MKNKIPQLVRVQLKSYHVLSYLVLCLCYAYLLFMFGQPGMLLHVDAVTVDGRRRALSNKS